MKSTVPTFISILGLLSISVTVVVAAGLAFWFGVVFLICSLNTRDYNRGQCLVKMEHDPVYFKDPDITDCKFELDQWQSDNIDDAKIRQSMVRDMVQHHKDLFMNQPATKVKKMLGADAAL
jgi:hypothetical protein